MSEPAILGELRGIKFSPASLHVVVMEIERDFNLKPIGLPGMERTKNDLAAIIRRAQIAIEFLDAAKCLCDENRHREAKNRIKRESEDA
jgi:hypothetical protein